MQIPTWRGATRCLTAGDRRGLPKRRLAAAIAILAVAGCTAKGADVDRGDAARTKEPGSLLTSLNPPQEASQAVKVGTVTVWTMSLVKAKADVELLSSSFVRKSQGLELLDTRVSRYGANERRGEVAGYPGLLCAPTWPPPGFGPTRPLAGTRLAEGDSAALTVYLRAAGKGDFEADALRVTYATEDGVFVQDLEASKITQRARNEEDLAPPTGNCNPANGSPWLE